MGWSRRRQALAQRWTRLRRARLLTAIAAACTLAFVLLALLLRRAAGSDLDVAVTLAVQRVDNLAFETLMVAISALGFWPLNWMTHLAAALGFWLASFRREALFVLATAGAGLVSGIAKLLVERPRPTADVVRVLSGVLDYSYPSGHVVSYVSFYGFLFFLVYVLFKRSAWRTAALTGLGLLVALVGVSRIALGHHWASDVVGGYALGTAYLLLLIVLYRLTGSAAEASAPTRGDV